MINQHLKKLKDIKDPYRNRAYNRKNLRSACIDSLGYFQNLTNIIDNVGVVLNKRFEDERGNGNPEAMQCIDNISKEIADIILEEFNVASDGTNLKELDKLIKEL